MGELILRGALAEAREDYPYLSEEDSALARIYTAAYPKLTRDRASRKSRLRLPERARVAVLEPTPLKLC